MLNNVQILDLSDELLVRVLARSTHHRVGHLLSLHLLGNLAGSYVVLDIDDTGSDVDTYHYRCREGRRKQTGDQKYRGSTS
jgi:hypothetical protein